MFRYKIAAWVRTRGQLLQQECRQRADFTFKNASNANQVEVKDVREKFSDLPSNFTIGTIGAAK